MCCIYYQDLNYTQESSLISSLIHWLSFCRLPEWGRSNKACTRPICKGTYPATGKCVRPRCKLLATFLSIITFLVPIYLSLDLITRELVQLFVCVVSLSALLIFTSDSCIETWNCYIHGYHFIFHHKLDGLLCYSVILYYVLIA